MADIGFIAIILALAASIYSVIAFVYGAWRGYPELVASARNGVLAVCGLVSLAALALLYALITHHFEIEYVASYTSRDMSLVYLLSAFWGGNAGSLLFWAWILSVCGAVVLIRRRNGNREFQSYTSAIIVATQAFFLILLIFVLNPFEKLSFTPADGMGLNPLLENPGMILHPPALLAGYVALTIPFALAVAALIAKRPDSEWIGRARKWTLFAWLLLGAGNIIGAWWAYVELGWGGYWAWDPVENAGLMPWLVATAFLHSIMVQRRVGAFKVWSVVLIIVSFNLSIFGTYLTRSGILSSVHTFGEGVLGPYFLTFIAIALVGPLVLVYWRRAFLKSEKRNESFISKESAFLLTNILLVGSALVVLLGTIYPKLSEVVRDTQTAVGEAFFNKVVGPIFLLLVLLVGVCIFLGWRRTSTRNLIRHGLIPLGVALLICLVLAVVGIREWYALTLFPLCGFVGFSHLLSWLRQVRIRGRMKNENPLQAFASLFVANKARYGGMIVHLGIVLMLMGIVASSFYETETEAGLLPGDSVDIQNYTLTYEGMSVNETPDKTTVTAKLSVYRGDKLLGEMTPEKYFHRSQEQPVTEVAIRTTPLEDLYVILGGWTEEGLVSFKILVNPLVVWIWVGGGLLVVGGLIAFWPGGRKREPEPDTDGGKGRRRGRT